MLKRRLINLYHDFITGNYKKTYDCDNCVHISHNGDCHIKTDMNAVKCRDFYFRDGELVKCVCGCVPVLKVVSNAFWYECPSCGYTADGYNKKSAKFWWNFYVLNKKIRMREKYKWQN